MLLLNLMAAYTAVKCIARFTDMPLSQLFGFWGGNPPPIESKEYLFVYPPDRKDAVRNADFNLDMIFIL